MTRVVIFIGGIILFFFTLIIFGCSRKYINEVPYKISYEQKEIENVLGLEKDTLAERLEEDYELNLTDKEIYLKEKYSIILKTLPKDIKNYKLYDFLDEWIGTPHAKSGFSTDSLNIVPFTVELYKSAYGTKLPKTALEIFKSEAIELFIGRKYLEEGDIIFFRYNKDSPVSDIGVYLKNNKVLASTKKSGLNIYNFNDEYFQYRFIAAGRLIPKEEKLLNEKSK